MLGTVKEIRRWPLKSMAGEELGECSVDERGVKGDRHFCLYTVADRRVVSAKRTEFPDLLSFEASYVDPLRSTARLDGLEIEFPDGRRFTADERGCVDALTTWFGREVGIGFVGDAADVRPTPGKHAMTGTFFDYAALHLLTDTSLRTLASAAPETQMGVGRCRPNLVIGSPATSGMPEADWVGRTLRLGPDVLIEVTDPCPRCVMFTLEQRDLPHAPRLLKTLAGINMQHVPVLDAVEPCIGVYAFVKRGGQVTVGDPVLVE